MTPLERAARAVYKLGDNGPYGPEDEDDQWHQHLDVVRAVLTAIREPMEALRPFAEIHDWVVSNGRSLDAIDFLIREDGRVLGHAMFVMEDVTKANAAMAMIDAMLAEEG